jgi:hypothetical protein
LDDGAGGRAVGAAAERASASFTEAMDRWDEAQADAAVASLARHAGAQYIFEHFARYGGRDFRSIGHKAIFVANAWRTLQCSGWRFAEPVLRSLAYALLNHSGEGNPADNDYEADRPWRENQQLVTRIRADWPQGDWMPKRRANCWPRCAAIPGATSAVWQSIC